MGSRNSLHHPPEREGGCTRVRVLDQELGLLSVQLQRVSIDAGLLAEPLHILGSSPLTRHSCVLPPATPGSCYLGELGSIILRWESLGGADMTQTHKAA